MIAPHPAAMVLATGLAAATALLGWRQAEGTRVRQVEVGFWFDEVSFASPRIGGPLTSGEIARARDTAAAELAAAFDGLRIRVTDNRRARYHVAVVQRVRDARMIGTVDVAGQSRGMAGLGGSGVVNFTLLANGAVVYAPDDLDRAAIVEAIGRGIGRSAAHEFAHQLLPRANLHAGRNRASYEYYVASRPEQYYGAIAWDVAGPLLRERFAAR